MNGVALKTAATARTKQKMLLSFAALAGVVIYFIYIAIVFDVLSLSQRANWTNARTLVADSYSYKTHITKSNRGAEGITAAIEGEKKGRYPDGVLPEWAVNDVVGKADITLRDGSIVELSGKVVRFDIPDYGLNDNNTKLGN